MRKTIAKKQNKNTEKPDIKLNKLESKGRFTQNYGEKSYGFYKNSYYIFTTLYGRNILEDE